MRLAASVQEPAGAAAKGRPSVGHLPAPSTDLKFGVGDGKLRYYLYNWRVAQELKPAEVGLIML